MNRPLPQYITITPEIAYDWVTTLNEGNRKINPARVKQYADDMRSGNWREYSAPIYTNRHGMIRDGQHRLHAIVESGVTLTLLVISGIDDETAAAIDRGYMRTDSQVAHFLGVPFSKTSLAAVRCAIYGPQYSTMQISFDAKRALLDRYADALDVVMPFAQKSKRLCSVSVLGACISGLREGIHRSIVTRFLEIVVGDRMPEGNNEISAHLLREYLLQTRGHPGLVMATERWDKTRRALKHFAEGNPITVLQGTRRRRVPA